MATDWSEAQANEIQYWEKAFAGQDNLRFFSTAETVLFTLKHFQRHHTDFTSFNEANLLDLGCGPMGHVVGMDAINKGYFKFIYGVDPLMNQYLTYGAMQETEVVKLVSAKVENLRLPLKFDVIISTNVVDHVDDPAAFLAKAADLLTPDGIFLVSVHCINTLLIPFKSSLKYIDKNHPHHFDPEQFKTLLSQHFRQTELTGTSRIVEDLPNYHWSQILTQPGSRSLRRLVGNLAMKSYYFRCSNAEKGIPN